MVREPIEAAYDRLATLREKAEAWIEFSYVENEGQGRVRFDRGTESAWADIVGPDLINYDGDERIIALLKKIVL